MAATEEARPGTSRQHDRFAGDGAAFGHDPTNLPRRCFHTTYRAMGEELYPETPSFLRDGGGRLLGLGAPIMRREERRLEGGGCAGGESFKFGTGHQSGAG